MEEKQGIVDSHIHILPPRRTAGLVRWVKKFMPQHQSREEVTPDEMLAELGACGVDTFFNLVFPLKEEETQQLNLFSREVADRYENVVGFGSLHLLTPDKDRVAERCVTEYGLAGIKLHPYAQLFEVFSPEFEPLYRKLAELGRPFLVHTGFDVFYKQTQDLEYLRGILERYPAMPVVLVHALFPRFGLAFELMGDYPQLYLDMTNSISAVRWYKESPDTWLEQAGKYEIEENLDSFNELFERYSRRIMFGTDHPVGMGSPAQIYADLEWFGFDPEVRADLLGRTARAFLEAHCLPT